MSFLLCLFTLLSLARPAQAEEYRRISTSDGRVLQAEIIATTAQWLSLRIPQGRLDVPFASVLSLEPMDAATYRSQPAWRILILPFGGANAAQSAEVAASVKDALGRVPGITVGTLESLATAGGSMDALQACGQNLDCASAPAGAAGFTAVVTGALTPDADGGALSVSAVFTGASGSKHAGDTLIVGAAPDHPAEVLKAAMAALQVRPDDAVVATLPARLSVPTAATPWSAPETPEAPAPAPAPAPPTSPWGPAPEATPPTPTTVAPPAAGVPTTDHLRALSWVPLPGAPSLARKDWAGVAESWGVVVPAAAVMVYGAGRATFTAPQMIGVSALSVYGLTVAVNSAFGLRRAAAIAVPTAGGAAVSVAVPLGGKP